ncbi:MAG: hypothetical protein JNN07_23220, partial [Verrucomicrobiales bacterium]|nr:hypothetical protein [Verrucomicrobiales bacterium]
MALVLSNSTSRVFESFSLSYLGQQWQFTQFGMLDRLDFNYSLQESFQAGSDTWNGEILNPISIIPHEPSRPEDFWVGFVDPPNDSLDYISTFATGDE